MNMFGTTLQNTTVQKQERMNIHHVINKYITYNRWDRKGERERKRQRMEGGRREREK